MNRLQFPQQVVRMVTLPVLFAPAGVFGFHHVEGERVARRLRAVQFALMDDLTVDEDESTCLKETSLLLSFQIVSASTKIQGQLKALEYTFSFLVVLDL